MDDIDKRNCPVQSVLKDVRKIKGLEAVLEAAWNSTVGVTWEKYLKAKLAKLKQGDENA